MIASEMPVTKCRGAGKMCSLSNAETVYRSSVSYILVLVILPRLKNIVRYTGDLTVIKKFEAVTGIFCLEITS